MDKITVLQHNTLHWRTNKSNLIITYKTIDPDIILLNSHGVKNEEPLKIYGYTTYKINSSNERNDGSAILIKSHIKHKIEDNFITDVLQIKIETSLGPINIATTYLPPRRPYLPFPDFHKIASNQFPTYIIGDLNAKHHSLGDNYNNTVGKGLKRMLDFNKLIHLGPQFTTYTSQTSNTTPDIVLSNNKTYHNHTVEAGPPTTSDHIPIILTITASAIKSEIQPHYNLKKANWENFQNTIANNINQVIPPDNANPRQLDQALGSWFRVIETAMENNIPKSNKRTILKPIQNKTIKSFQFYLQNIINLANTQGWTPMRYKAYMHIKNALRAESTNQQNKNWENKLTNLAQLYKTPQKFWKEIEKLKGGTNNSHPYIIHNNNKLYSEEEKEPVFRKIWENIFQISPEENTQFDQRNEHRVINYLHTNSHLCSPNDNADRHKLDTNNYTIRPITVDDVQNTLKHFKNNSPGNSKINKKVLTNLPDEAIQILTHIFNLAYSLGHFPKPFKIAKIILIPKPNKNGSNPIDYRPISLLEVPGKIYEKILNQRLRTFLEINNKLPNSQHGFRTGRGTDTAIAITTEKIAETLATKQQCNIVLRDVSKAFDKVWHDGLKFKILQLGLPEILSKSLCTFLDNRQAFISIKQFKGPIFQIKSGVPQGSSLSPTLYTIYTADIPAPAHGSLNIMYADDITQIIVHPSKSRKIMAKRVESEIKKINTFEEKWKIKTNQNKFKIIPLATSKNEPININGQILPYATEGNILGLHFNRRGITPQVRKNKHKAQAALTILRRFAPLPTKIKLHLVKACIIPTLHYPAYALNTLSKTSLIKLQRIQNKALRFAYNDRFPYQHLIENLHLQANVKPINSFVFDRGKKITETLLHNLHDPIFTDIANNNNDREHGWFRRPSLTLNRQEPAPLYTM